MTVYYTDVAQKGTILRPASAQKEGEILCVWRPPVGATLADGDPVSPADQLVIADLGTYIRPTSIRVTSNGLAGTNTPGSRTASGLVMDVGFVPLTGIVPTADPDGFINDLTDAEDLIVIGSEDSTYGTVFPGTGVGGTKQIYNPNGNLRIIATVVTSNTSVFTEGAELTFYIKYSDADYARTHEEPVTTRLTLTPQGLNWGLENNMNGMAY